MADILAVVLHELGEETSAGSGEVIDIGELRSLLAGAVRLTAKTGTGNVSVLIETSPDGSSGWRTLRSIAAFGSVSRVEFHVDNCERYVRVSWTMTSVTAATFSVLADAHVLYAKRADLALSINDSALDGQDAEKLAKCLLSATSDIDDALNSGYPLPLTTWPPSISQRSADIATWRVMKAIGFQPEGSDEVIRLGFEDANKWLRMVAERKLTPAGLTPVAADANRTTSGNPSAPDEIRPRMSDNWGDFG